MRREDVVFDNLKEKVVTEEGERRWFVKGVNIYKWNDSYEHILRPHRFAVCPKRGCKSNFEQIKANRWYVHVYQTKTEISYLMSWTGHCGVFPLTCHLISQNHAKKLNTGKSKAMFAMIC